MMLAKMILFTNDPAHTLNNIELQKDRISFLSVYFSAVGKQLKTFFHQQRPITGTHDTCFFAIYHPTLIPTVLKLLVYMSYC